MDTPPFMCWHARLVYEKRDPFLSNAFLKEFQKIVWGDAFLTMKKMLDLKGSWVKSVGPYRGSLLPASADVQLVNGH